jgi:hypothetical protein
VSPHWPHPEKHPQGHSHGRPEALPPPLDLARWGTSRAYLHGIDLFNHGYYWEAHEAWEGLWNACGREGPAALFLKGLIKLAAAGVKVRQGMPEGVRIHCERAIRHFDDVEAALGPRAFGLALDDLRAFARGALAGAATGDLRGDPTKTVEVVFDRPLTPAC